MVGAGGKYKAFMFRGRGSVAVCESGDGREECVTLKCQALPEAQWSEGRGRGKEGTGVNLVGEETTDLEDAVVKIAEIDSRHADEKLDGRSRALGAAHSSVPATKPGETVKANVT